MKIALITTFTAVQAFASLYNQHIEPHSFSFRSAGETITIETQAGSYEEAFEMASLKCFDDLTRRHGEGEQMAMQIIDVCANPVR